MQNVVIGSEDHQHYDYSKPYPESHLLRALRQRFSPHRFDGVEQQVTAVEQRHGKEIEKTDGDGEHRRQAQQGRQSFRRHLTRHLGYANRPSKLIGCLTPGNHTDNVGERAIDDEPRSLNAQLQRLESADRLKVDIVG